MKKLVIVDAYGTLFDVNAAARNYSKKTADSQFISIWEKVSSLWRDKQIAYTWYYNSIGYKTNFWKVTEDALDYALEYYNLRNLYFAEFAQVYPYLISWKKLVYLNKKTE